MKIFLQALLRARQTYLKELNMIETEKKFNFKTDSDGNSVSRQRMRFLWMSKISEKTISKNTGRNTSTTIKNIFS